MRLPRVRTTLPAPAAPPKSTGERSAGVQEKVERAAVELAEVNDVLSDELRASAPTMEVERALSRSEDVEVKVQEAAEDLADVTHALEEEAGERAELEQRLGESEAALLASQRREKKTWVDAMHDQLTGLPTVTLFNDRLNQGLAQAQRHGWKLAVMFLDLDKFKTINDTHGHGVGDGALALVAQRLRAGMRASDTVCRRSGDEFLLLMLEVRTADAPAALAAKLLASLAGPAQVQGVTLSVRASIGVSVFPDDGATAQELVERADGAMYSAKRSGTGVALASGANA